jgi:hypothetical protein
VNNRKREQHEAVREPRKSRAAHEFERAAGNDSLAAEFIKSNVGPAARFPVRSD